MVYHVTAEGGPGGRSPLVLTIGLSSRGGPGGRSPLVSLVRFLTSGGVAPKPLLYNRLPLYATERKIIQLLFSNLRLNIWYAYVLIIIKISNPIVILKL